MPIDQNLSNFSDLAFQTTFVIYTVALILALVYYGKIRTLVEARRAARESASVTAYDRSPAYAAAGDSAPAAGAGLDGGNDAFDDAEEAELDATARPGISPEDSRRERSADKLGGVIQAFLWVGVVIHFVAAALRGVATGRFPLGNLYEYILLFTAAAMLASVIVIQRKEWRTLWPWILVPILALMFYGSTKLYAESAPVVPALQSYWLPIHVSIVSLGGSIGLVSGVGSLLHMLRVFQPKGMEKGFWGKIAIPLPSAAKLDRLAYRSAIVTLPVFGLGIVLGAIWAEGAWGRYWGWDPKETVSFISWILYAAYLHARATPSWRMAAPWINIIALATMIFNLFFINLVVSGLHSYAGLN